MTQPRTPNSRPPGDIYSQSLPAAPTKMSDEQLRLECLKLAVTAEARATGPTTADSITRGAAAFHAYVKGGL